MLLQQLLTWGHTHTCQGRRGSFQPRQSCHFVICTVQAARLRLLRLQHGGAVRFGGLLRMVGDQTLNSCAPEDGASSFS